MKMCLWQNDLRSLLALLCRDVDVVGCHSALEVIGHLIVEIWS
jgi:hypothetical protein